MARVDKYRQDRSDKIMFFEAADLLNTSNEELKNKRGKLSHRPTLALIWVGDDKQTGKFVAVKQKKAQELECDFVVHHFEKATQRQLEALIDGLAENKNIDGIVLQLPLPKNFDVDRLIAAIPPEKDVDGLTVDSPYVCPTPTGIINLLKANEVDLANSKTVIVGAGRLVGLPLSKIFKQNGWSHQLITQEAEKRASEIREADILISCTGVAGLISPEMVSSEMMVVDGSGIDVDVKVVEPLVKKITPVKGAIGPLTVCYLFDNLLTAASR